MRPYYASLFPAKALFEWLNYGYFDDDLDKKKGLRIGHGTSSSSVESGIFA